MITPEVSICCITYNHAKYIRDALDSFLMQKTTFPIEIIIHDDASTDGTADIIREYEAKYPDIIKPIYQTENQYSKGVRIFLSIIPLAKGKYIAVCEGDDFWTDPKKLQIQYDFMESHPDYSLCMHGRYNLDCFNNRYYPEPFAEVPENGFECANKLALGCFMSFTQTFFFRKKSYEAKQYEIVRDSEAAPMGDIQIVFHLALQGNVKYIKKHMATYRRSAGSITHTSLGDDSAFLQKCEDFTIAMLVKSGHADWAEEREKRKLSREEGSVSPEKKNIFQLLRHFIGKIHFALFKFKARVKFWLYIKRFL